MGKDYEEIDWDNGEYNENGEWVNHSSGKNDEEETMIVKDAHGNILQDGDTIAAIKDLPVKGGQNIKRGDKFTKIKLTDDASLVESGKMVLRTEFFKKI